MCRRGAVERPGRPRDELQDISRQVRASKQDYEAAEAWAGFARGLGFGLTGIETLGRQAGDLSWA